MPNSPSYASRVRGCLLGGAIGDALGGSMPGASDNSASANSAPGLVFSSRTQLTLYTVDGLVELIDWANSGLAADEAATLWLAYLRWLRTQDEIAAESSPAPVHRWIDSQAALHHRRDPDPATLKALASGEMGTVARPLNPDSFSAVPLVRCVPLGLIPHIPVESAVALARNAAALTHSRADVVAGAANVAALIHRLMQDAADLENELGSAAAELPPASADNPEGTPGAAVNAVRSAVARPGSPVRHFRAALDSATAPGADPASAGALAGSMLGAFYGEECLPAESIAVLEDAGLIEAMAAELLRVTTGA